MQSQSTDELLAFGRSLYGVEIDEVLERVPDIERVVSLIQRFLAHYSGAADEWSSRVRQGDRDAVLTAAHTCKGTAGMLGISAIVAASLRVENSLKCDGPERDVLLAIENYDVELQRVAQGMTVFPPPPGNPG